MKFENTQVMNFEGALRGMRNPKNSWNKSDSLFDIVDVENSMIDYAVAEKWMNKYYSNLEDDSEELRQKYLTTKDTRYWKELVRWLPESWLQTRTWTANYETILSICHQRRSHKLNEWSGIHTQVEDSFIQWARTLPYAQEFLFFDETTEQVL